MPRATNGYGRMGQVAIPPREAEAAAFGLVNRLLENADTPPARVSALARNQKLWSLLLRDLALGSNALPPGLKSDLVRLGAWSLRYSVRAMGGALPVAPLLAVNRDMIAGLAAPDVGPPQPVRAPAPPAGLAVAL